LIHEAAGRKGVQQYGTLFCVRVENRGRKVPGADDVQDDATAQFDGELEVTFQQFGLLRWGEWAAQSVDAAFADSRGIVREKHFAQGDVPVSGERVRKPRVNPEGGNDVFGEPLVKRGEGGPVARVKSGDHLAPNGITDAVQLGSRARETMEMVVCVVH
jgi:hypothetical protein